MVSGRLARPEKAECIAKMRDGRTVKELAAEYPGIPISTIRGWKKDYQGNSQPEMLTTDPSATFPQDASPVNRALEVLGESATDAGAPDSPASVGDSNVAMTAEALVAMSEGLLGTGIVVMGMTMGLSVDQIAPYQAMAPSERQILRAMAPAALPAFQKWVSSPAYAGYIYCLTFGLFGIGHAFGLRRYARSVKKAEPKIQENAGGVSDINKVVSLRLEPPRAAT